MKIIESPQYGPMFRFTDANVYWALHILSSGKRIGRKKLADDIGVGEGSMRRIIETLRERDMIMIKQTGITITKTGLSYIERIPIEIVDVNIGDAVYGRFQKSIVVRGVAEKIQNGMQQRDVGIRVGALGCTTIVIRDGKLMMPPDWMLDEKNPELAETIYEKTKLTDKDALIVGSADDDKKAMVAALTAAFELI